MRTGILTGIFLLLSNLVQINYFHSENRVNLNHKLHTTKLLDPLIFADFFSPNNDGHNDTFVIENIDEYPINKIHIFNRWGDKVFEAEPYLNNWDGTINLKNQLLGNQLPEGIYVYRFEYLVGDFVTRRNGKIMLKR